MPKHENIQTLNEVGFDQHSVIFLQNQFLSEKTQFIHIGIHQKVFVSFPKRFAPNEIEGILNLKVE